MTVSLLQPGASLDAAYQKANPGDVYELVAGDYSTAKQTIRRRVDGMAMTTPVLFRPAVAGSDVFLGSVMLQGDGVELADMRARGVALAGGAVRRPAGTPTVDSDYVCDLTLRNMLLDSVGKNAFNAHRAKRVKVIGGEWTSSVRVDTDNMLTSTVDVLIEKVHVHHWLDVGPGELHHIEGLQVGGADGLTIRECVFEHNATHNVFMRSWGTTFDGDPQPMRRIVIEGNTFRQLEGGGGYYLVQLMDDLVPASEGETDAIVRGNSFEQGMTFRFDKGVIEFCENRYPGLSQYVVDQMLKPPYPVDGHDNVYKSGTAFFPGDTVDPNVDLSNPPATDYPDEGGDCDACEQELEAVKAELVRTQLDLKQTQADLDTVRAQLTTTTGQLADALAANDALQVQIDNALAALSG